ncbi:DUF2971 domain-containing protein [Thalassospira lucentensis]|uniref:DUF2971 domain-containing protein n=1 Tax=Thalassospira lucentensis TaxID=168935 RepID=UPI003D2F4F43
MKQLFKYMSEPRDFFENGYIRLTQIAALNDPFEATFSRTDLELLALECDEKVACNRQTFPDFIETNLSKLGAISLSENKENLLMWAHYADEHKGILAGISYHAEGEGLKLFEHLLPVSHLFSDSLNTDYSPFDGKPKPVSYRKSPRYRNDKFDHDYSNVCVESGDRFLYEVCMQKSDEWIYEQEYRIVLRLEQSDRVIAPKGILDPLLNPSRTHHIHHLLRSYTVPSEAEPHCYITDLSSIDDEVERIACAKTLTNLSKSRDVIYLMKLDSSAINNCIFGLNSEISKQNLHVNHATKTGYLDYWKARKCENHYGLEFDEI